MSYDALFFDLDGTLVDSLPDLTVAVNSLRTDLGLTRLNSEQVRNCIGDGARLLVTRALPERAFIEEYLEIFLAHYRGHLASTTGPYPGIPEMLEKLAGVPLALITNKPQEMAETLLANLGLAHHFRFITGGDRYPEKKPHPLPLQMALAELGISPKRALMIGDHHTDLRAARMADMHTCFCDWGYGNDGGEHPDHRVASVAELTDLICTTA